MNDVIRGGASTSDFALLLCFLSGFFWASDILLLLVAFEVAFSH